MEEIKGYVEHIVFRNNENGYTVFRLNNEDGEIDCVGNFHYIDEGELLELTGEYVNHPVYGRQFRAASAKVCEPEDLVSIERYLGSGAIRGVGAALAGKIVKKFKEDTFRIIEEEPERLAEIKGISERKAFEISQQVEGKRDLRNAMIYLQKYGISAPMAAKIYQYYENRIYHILEENPYQMADHIAGIGFRTADEIAKRIGIHADSDFRIQSGLYYVLLQSVGEGHIYLLQESLCRKAEALLETRIEHMEKYLIDLAMERRIVLKEGKDGKRVYAANYYYMELNTARMLHDLDIRYDDGDQGIERRLGQIERQMEMPLEEMQRIAVIEAVKHGVFILTGGPGTGKTTTINAIIRYFESEGMDICLGAPTGRAAKRMAETTGYEARTIHRLLEINGNPEDEEQKNEFLRNMGNPLEADVVIIDEMSMVDLPLMYALVSAVSVGTRLILVGDQNQLPSVGPGSVLKDMVSSHCFSMVMLTRIFRQAGESDIIVNAHRINRGEAVVADNKSRDFFFLKRQDPDAVISVVLTLIRNKLPRYVHADICEIQVLTPMRKGLLGVERLNGILQEYLNPPDQNKAEKEYGGRKFRVGDKVMQIKNNYQLEWEIRTPNGIAVDRGAGIFNGDMGVIRDINPFEEAVRVEYDEHRVVTYAFEQLEELELAYAITIHKSQGSEYPAVIIPLLQGPQLLYHRNLLYTAVTRARKCVVLVGSDAVFQAMIQNANEQNRNTSLDERLCEVCV